VLEDELKQPGHKRHRKLIIILVILTVLAAGGVGGWVYLNHANQSSPIPAAVRQQVDFPLYYPSRLPEGYSVSQAPAVSEGVAAMAIRTPSGNTIFISQQAAPTGLNYQKFLSDELKRPQEFSTPIGIGYTGGPVGRVFGSILTPKTWILSNANFMGSAGLETKELLGSFVPAN